MPGLATAVPNQDQACTTSKPFPALRTAIVESDAGLYRDGRYALGSAAIVARGDQCQLVRVPRVDHIAVPALAS